MTIVDRLAKLRHLRRELDIAERSLRRQLLNGDADLTGEDYVAIIHKRVLLQKIKRTEPTPVDPDAMEP